MHYLSMWRKSKNILEETISFCNFNLDQGIFAFVFNSQLVIDTLFWNKMVEELTYQYIQELSDVSPDDNNIHN